MNKSDYVHLKRMLKEIDLFYGNILNIFFLINDLEAILNTLESIDHEWKERFRSYWLNLEVVYAFDLHPDKKFTDFDDNNLKIIEDSLENLKSLLNEEISSLSNSDLSNCALVIILDENWVMCPSCLNAWESISKEKIFSCPQCNEVLRNAKGL